MYFLLLNNFKKQLNMIDFHRITEMNIPFPETKN